MITHDSGDWCRVVMDRETRQLVAGLNYPQLDALEISGGRWKLAGFRSYESRVHPEFDLCGEVAAARFDIVIAAQVLEHVVDPDKALENCKRLLRPGGHLLVTTPFLIRYHPEPLDLWRWTEAGLRLLFERHGFQVISSGSWGNMQCLVMNLSHWAPYLHGHHSLENDPRFPLVVWALGCTKEGELERTPASPP